MLPVCPPVKNGCNRLVCTHTSVVEGIGGPPLVWRCCSEELLLCLCSASLGCEMVVLVKGGGGPKEQPEVLLREGGNGMALVFVWRVYETHEGSEIKKRGIKEAANALRCWSCRSCRHKEDSRGRSSHIVTAAYTTSDEERQRDTGSTLAEVYQEGRGGHGKVLDGCERVQVAEEHRAAARPGDGAELAGQRSLPRTAVNPGCRQANH